MKTIFHLLTVFICFSANALSFGTGFFVSTDGHIITNAHVIKDGKKFLVQSIGKKPVEAEIVSVDHNNDLALMKIPGPTNALHVKSIQGIEKGGRVFTIGYPNPSLQGFEAKYTDGVISSFSGLRGNQGVMQITVPIQPGNSGGPLVDGDGSVIGVIVSKINALAVAAKQDYIPENVNFAIKGDYAIPLLMSLNAGTLGKKKVRNAKDVEDATVLISSLTQADILREERSEGREPNRQPAQNNTPAPERSVSLMAPSVVENGCVIPVGFSVIPSLFAGDKAVFKINGLPAFSVNVLNGSVREVQFRVKAESSATFSVDCPGCKSVNFRADVKLGCPHGSEQPSLGGIRMRVENDHFRSLIDGVYDVADFNISSPSLNVIIQTTPAAAKNPFVSIKSDKQIAPPVCIKINTPSGSRENCS